MLLRDFIRKACDALASVYPPEEARSIVALYCEEKLGVKSYTHILQPDFCIPEEKEAAFEADLRRLSGGEPVQYVLGSAFFCGRKFKVNPGVLIPRPETEGLVALSEEGLAPGARILDLCTGSGCIAWTLALDNPGSEVTAVDISREAIRTAESQFPTDGPRFVLADILCPSWTEGMGKFDLVVSNPPYVMERERSEMRLNVLGFEPGIALFVPDSDPLVFYRAVAEASEVLLKDSGRGVVEINEQLGEETRAVFAGQGFSKVEIFPDFRGKPRYIRFEK